MENLPSFFTSKLNSKDKEHILFKLNEYFNECDIKSSSYPSDIKEMYEHISFNYKEHITKEIETVCNSVNPRFELRKKIVHSAYSMAHLAVFFIEDTGLEVPYTSKEMKNYMPLLFKTEPNLIHFTQILSIPLEELSLFQIEYIFTYSFLRATFILNAYNHIRILFNDKKDEIQNDWYLPMIFSMYIAVEQNYRKKLNMPSLINSENVEKEQTFFFLWFKIFEVLDIEDPKQFWISQWEKHLNKKSPF